MNAIIYSKPNCRYCTLAKELLNRQAIEYQEFIINPDKTTFAPNQQTATKAQLLELLPNATTVPQIWLDGKHIGGYTELDAFFKG